MKTKNILALILVLGLSFNAFSQEKITIKYDIKNTAKDKGSFGDDIQVIRISTNLPVTIKPGKENAIYLTGDMEKNEKEKLSSFCELKNNVFKINSPYLYIDGVGRVKELYDFTITLELTSDVYAYFLSSRANVILKKDIISDGHGLFNLEAHSQMTVEGDVELNVLSITAKEDSKIRFNSIDAELAILTMGEKSIIDLNGKVKDIEVSEGVGSKIIGDYTSNTLMTHHADIVDINDPNKVTKIQSIVYNTEDIKSNQEVYINDYIYMHNGVIIDTFAFSSFQKVFDKDSIYNTNEGETILKKGETKPSEHSSSHRTVLYKDGDIVVGKNTNVRFLFAEGMSEDYISNYPIKGSSDGKIVIQDDYPIDLVVTLRKDIGNLTIHEGANVIIGSEINEKDRSYYLLKNATLIFEKKSKFENITLALNDSSKVIFKDLKTDQFSLQGNGHSELEINGEIETLIRYKYDDINITGKNKIGSIKEKTLKTLELNIPYINFKDDQKENDISNSKTTNKVERDKKLGRDKINFDFVFDYGRLKWSKGGGIDNLYSNPEGAYSLRSGNSWNLGFRYKYNLDYRWQISTGLGYESNIFRFDNNVMLTDIGGEKRINLEIDPAIESKSKLVARYVTIPFFLKYKVIHNSKFYIHAGVIAGVNFSNSSTGFKRNYDITNGEVQERWGNKYNNFKPLKLDLQAGFGWQSINFYIKYALTPLFKDNTEIEVYPFSVGLSLGI
ncbi:MAG: porin family protein [Bacteroidales bacterium]